MEESKKGKLNIILVIIIIILLGICSYLTYDKFFKENKKEDVSTDNVLNIYGYKFDEKSYICKEKSDSCNEVILNIKTESANAFIMNIEDGYSINESTYVLYFDNGIKVYKTSSKITNEIETTISNDKLSNYIKNKWNKYNYISGGFIFSYIDDTTKENFYYDIQNAEKKFTDYTDLSPVPCIDNSITFGYELVLSSGGYSYGVFSTDYIIGNKDNKSFLINIKTGKEVVAREDLGIGSAYFLHQDCNGNHIVFAFDNAPDGSYTGKALYTIDGKKIRDISKDEVVEFNNCQYGGEVKVYKTEIVDTY